MKDEIKKIKTKDFIFYERNGRIHAEDGPAVIELMGNKYWYLNGISLTKQYELI